jgi:glycosyltransferase involved in cell wall biosynthesis
MRLLLAAAEEQYYHEAVKPLVDDKQIVYVGEVDFDAKVKLFGGARALLYPVQAGEPFGLVLAEAMACGTPVAALDRGAVREVVDDGMTGGVFADIDAMVNGLARVLTLDRGHVRAEAVRRFGIMSMVDGYVDAFHRIVAQWKAR